MHGAGFSADPDADTVVELDDLGRKLLESSVASWRPPGILVVDDDQDVRTLLELVLHKHGFAVWMTHDGYQAIRAYQGHRADIDLVLLDVRMPGLDGPATVAGLRQLNPGLRFCFMTSDPGSYTEEDLMDQGAECIIYKPFRLEEVVQILNHLLTASRAHTVGPASAVEPCRVTTLYREWQPSDNERR